MIIPGHTLRWLSSAIETAYAARTHEQLTRDMVTSIHRQFRAVISACESVSEDGTQFQTHQCHGELTLPADYHLYVWDNPNAVLLMQGECAPVLHIRGNTSRYHFERTDFFNVVARPNALHDQLNLIVRHHGLITGLNVNRDRILSSEDRFILELLHPHFQAALIRLTPSPAEAVQRDPWLLLSPEGNPMALSPSQTGLLRAYFPRWQPSASPLPQAVHTWLRCSQTELSRGALAKPIRALIVDSPRGRLGLRYFPPGRSACAALRLTESPTRTGFLSLIKSHHLTARECEVLDWIAQGKRNTEIAAILGCSPRTVGKHIEQLFLKLSATNRTAAVAHAQNQLRSHAVTGA